MDKAKKTLSYDLELIEIPVKLTDKDGKVLEYVLRELTGKARDSHMNFIREKTGTNDKGESELIDFNGIQAKLVSMSLIDSDGKHPEANIVLAWPSRVVTGLYEEAKAISKIDVDDEEEEELGNDLEEKKSTGTNSQ